jgi:hypothetical protein
VDKLIFVNKNWPFNLWIGCLKPTNFAFACEVKSKLMVELEAKFKNEVEGEDFSNLHDFI